MLLTMALGLAVASSAVAQPALAPPSPTSAPARPRPKSPATAWTISTVATAASIGLTVTHEATLVPGLIGLTISPTLGHWYAGSGDGWNLLVRAGASVAFVKGYIVMSGIMPSDCDYVPGATPPFQNCVERPHPLRYKLAFFGGGALLLGSTIWSIVTSPRAARRWNEKQALSIGPMVAPASSGGSLGVVVGGRF